MAPLSRSDSRSARKRTDQSGLLQSRSRLAAYSLPLFSVLIVACAQPAPRDLGFTESAQQPATATDHPLFTSVTDFLGTWVGAAEEPLATSADGSIGTYRFPSGSSQIALAMENRGGLLTGHITFGAGDPPPPPEDADAGYPVGVGYDALIGYVGGGFDPVTGYTGTDPTNDDGALGTLAEPASLYATMLPPFEGFAYTTTFPDGTTGLGSYVGDGVLYLDYNTNEPLAPWCEMQTPYEQSVTPGTYTCVPDCDGYDGDGSDGTGKMCTLFAYADGPCNPTPASSSAPNDISENMPGNCGDRTTVAQVDCDKLTICHTGYCSCDATSCSAAQTPAHLILHRDGDELIGMFEDARFKNADGFNTPIGNVRLHRQ